MIRQGRGPKVHFPVQFPRPSEDSPPLQKCKSLTLNLLQSQISPSDFFAALSAVPLTRTDHALAVVSSVLLFLVHSAPYHLDFVPEFTDIFSALIGHQDDCVRRSCFSLLSVLSASDLFAACLKVLTAAAESWSEPARATFLSFASGFKPPAVIEFSGLVPLAVGWTSAGDRALSAGARDFVDFMNFVDGAARAESKPRPRIPRPRRLLDGTRKSREKAPKLSPPRVNELPLSRHSVNRSSAKSEAPEIFGGLDVEEYLTCLTDSIDLSATEPDDGQTTQRFIAGEEEEEDSFLQVERLVSQRRSGVGKVTGSGAKRVRSVEEEEFFGSEADRLAMLSDRGSQLEAINHFLRQVDRNPVSVAPHCQELWSKLSDLILSSQPVVVEAALELAGQLFAVFSQQLSGNAASMIVIAFNFLGNSNRQVSQLADHLLAVIAHKAPRAKVLQVFVAGTKHKSSVVRGKAASSIEALARQSRLDDRELAAVLQALAPLLRDVCTETRAHAVAALGVVSADARFQSVAIAVVKNSQDFRELMTLVD
jgi:hypothetical protein